MKKTAITLSIEKVQDRIQMHQDYIDNQRGSRYYRQSKIRELKRVLSILEGQIQTERENIEEAHIGGQKDKGSVTPVWAKEYYQKTYENGE